MLVTNLVFTTDVGVDLDLEFLHSHLSSTYNPDRFRGLVLKVETGTCLVFHNGKIVIVGTKSRKEAARTLGSLVDSVEGLGFEATASELKLRNIVAYHNYNTPVNLELLYTLLRNNHTVSFEPELSPALMIQIPETIRIFHNGKVIFTGLKSFDRLDVVYEFVEKLLKSQPS